MNVYVETNFIVELALLQEEHQSCRKVIEICKSGRATLVVPTFSLAESYEKVVRQADKRATMASGPLLEELQQLSRSEPIKDEIGRLTVAVSRLLSRVSTEDDQRLTTVLEQMLNLAEVIPLDADVVSDSIRFRALYGLKVTDSIVYSSVLRHLSSMARPKSCFITRDKDFGDRDIVKSLTNCGCAVFYKKFVDGCTYVERFASAQPGE